jgi:hypothetical protein
MDSGLLAKENQIISAEEYSLWQRKEALRRNVIKVDDFPQDFGRAETLAKFAKEEIRTEKSAAEKTSTAKAA